MLGRSLTPVTMITLVAGLISRARARTSKPVRREPRFTSSSIPSGSNSSSSVKASPAVVAVKTSQAKRPSKCARNISHKSASSSTIRSFMRAGLSCGEIDSGGPGLFLDQLAVGALFAVGGPKAQATGNVGNLSRAPLNLQEPSAIGNVVKANRAALQPVFLAQLGIGLLHPKIQQLKNALGRFVIDRRLHFHARLVRTVQPRTFEGQHGDVGAVTAETKLAALVAQTIVAIEKLIPLESTGVRLSSELEQSRTKDADIRNPILLLALNAAASDVPLELARQIFFKFPCSHAVRRNLITTLRNVVKRPTLLRMLQIQE